MITGIVGVVLLGAAPIAETASSNWVVVLRLHEGLAQNAELEPIIGPGLQQLITKNGGLRVGDDTVETARTALNLAEVTLTDLPNLLDSVAAQHALLLGSREEEEKIVFTLERYDRVFELFTTVERTTPAPQAVRALRQALADLLTKPKTPRTKTKPSTTTEAPSERPLGLRLATLPPEKAKALGLKNPQGALIVEVLPDRAAAAAGLQADDVLLIIGKARLRGAFEAPGRLFAMLANPTIPIEVWRNGEKLKRELFGPPVATKDSEPSSTESVDAATSTAAPSPAVPKSADPNRSVEAPSPPAPPRQLGAKLRAVTPVLAESLGLMGPTGALVVTVKANTIAANAGLAANDVILTFNEQAVTHAKQVATLVRDSAPRLRVPVEVWRNRAKISLTIVFPEPPAPAKSTAPSPTPKTSEPDSRPTTGVVPERKP